MATTNCLNAKAYAAPNGVSAYVTLSGAESLSILPLLSIGTACTINSSNKTGYVDFIDSLGHSFRIKPVAQNKACDSNTTGILKVNEIITITH